MRETREHVHNSCRNIALVTQACATLSQHSVFDDGSSQLPHSAVVVKAVWWLVLGLVSLHSGGWQKRNMSISVNGVTERHWTTFWNYAREYLQSHSIVGRFRDGRNSDCSSLLNFCVSFEFIVSNTTKTSSYFSLHSFSSSLTFWNMLTIINYYNIFVSWLSQSKLQKK